MKIKHFALAALAALSVGSAQGVPVLTNIWGPHLPVESAAILALGGTSFDNVYTFSLLDSYDLKATAVTNDSTGNYPFNLDGSVASLYVNNLDLNFTNDTLVGSFAFDNAPVTKDFGTLGAGFYFYRLTGSSPLPALAGSGLLLSTVTAVPEPETYAMLLSGLGLLGFMSRRRKESNFS